MTTPYVIALTGGAGAGKSTAAQRFKALGATVIDSDTVSREVLEDPDIQAALVEAFGPGILDAGGGVDRSRLAEVAFRGTQSVAKLNAVMHPRISEIIVARLAELADDPDVVVVIEIPLLDAVPELAGCCADIVAIEAPLGARVGRLVERGIPEPDARRRIGLQPDDAQRRMTASAIVVNDSDAAAFDERLDRVWEHLTASRRRRASEGGARR